MSFHGNNLCFALYVSDLHMCEALSDISYQMAKACALSPHIIQTIVSCTCLDIKFTTIPIHGPKHICCDHRKKMLNVKRTLNEILIISIVLPVLSLQLLSCVRIVNGQEF